MSYKINGTEVIDNEGRGVLAGAYCGNYNTDAGQQGAIAGDIVYDANKGANFFWNGSKWVPAGGAPTSPYLDISVSTNSNVIISDASDPMGGTWRTLYCLVSTTLDVKSLSSDPTLNVVKYFIVGGGGGSVTAGAGGGTSGAGGGGGGVITGLMTVNYGQVPVTVGSGAALGTTAKANPGGTSRVGAVRAEGGGGGLHKTKEKTGTNYGNGASGGGAFWQSSESGLLGNFQPNTTTPAYQLPQGHNGGGGYRNAASWGANGGGGGAGGAGQTSNGNSNSNRGGIGVQSPDWVDNSYGDNGWFGGGGCGGWQRHMGAPSYGQSSPQQGGGGYGMGSTGQSTQRLYGLPNSGGGGGGKTTEDPGAGAYGDGGAGGSGFVALKWRIA